MARTEPPAKERPLAKMTDSNDGDRLRQLPVIGLDTGPAHAAAVAVKGVFLTPEQQQQSNCDHMVHPMQVPPPVTGPPTLAQGPWAPGCRRRRAKLRFRLYARLAVALHLEEKDVTEVLTHMFMQGSTGIDRLLKTSSNRFRFALWVVTYFCLVGGMIYFICQVVKNYYERSSTSRIAINEPPMLSFPAVTLCNLNFLRRSSFCVETNLNRVARDKICTQNASTLQRTEALQSLTIGLYDWFEESNKTQLFGRMKILGLMRRHGFTWNISLISCHIANKNCLDAKLIRSRFTTNLEYGLCFTLFAAGSRGDADTQSLLSIYKSDLPSDGLRIVLDAHPEEYLPFADEKGFLLTVHRPVDEPDISQHAVFVPTGRTSHIALSKSVDYLLEPPYETACSSSNRWPAILVEQQALSNLTRYRPYSKVTCAYLCRSLNLIEACNCTFAYSLDYALLCIGSGEYKRDPVTNMTCKDEFTSAPLDTLRKKNKEVKCFCPNRCRESKYRQSVTYSTFTSTVNPATITKQKYIRRKRIREQYAEVYVYFKSVIEDVMMLNVSYTAATLTGEVGGFIGCFVGMAFMNFFEIVETIVVTIAHYVLEGRWIAWLHI